VSGAGYFSIGYAATTPEEALGIWSLYHDWGVAEWDAENGTPWDTISPYPHHAVLAFVNTPFGQKRLKPEDVIPCYVHDSKWQFYAFRNRWQDANDIVISQLLERSHGYMSARADAKLVIQAHGKTMDWGYIPKPVQTFTPVSDGSAILSNGKTWLGIDFSGASGVDGLLVIAGPNSMRGDQSIEAGGVNYELKFLTDGKHPEAKAEGDTVVVGDQVISMADGELKLKVFAEPWTGPKVKAEAAPKNDTTPAPTPRPARPQVSEEERAEKAAAVRLSHAKKYLAVDKPKDAAKILTQILEKYPQTEAAAEAVALLATLDPDAGAPGEAPPTLPG